MSEFCQHNKQVSESACGQSLEANLHILQNVVVAFFWTVPFWCIGGTCDLYDFSLPKVKSILQILVVH